MRVLRIYHSAVVRPWRRRDVELRAYGVDERLVSSIEWNEGGKVVALEAHDQPWVVGARTWGHHPFRFVYDPRPLWRALRAGPLDVIDVHEEAASLAAAEVLALAWLAGHRRAAVSFYCAQNIQKRYPPPFRWIEQAVLRRAAAAHTCNDEAGRVLRRKGFSGLIRNLGLGVDVERFAPARPADPDGDAPVELRTPVRVGYVGRLEPHKGVDVLLEAVARTEGVHLTVVGDGPERAALEGRANRLGLGPRLALEGFAPQEALPDVYRRLDVLVVPSLETPSWIEQFGRVAVEAMASGVPVIASDTGSLPEVLRGSGVLVPPGDVAALADALAALRDDAERRRTLAEAGRKRSEHFSWPAVAERHLALYEEMTT